MDRVDAFFFRQRDDTLHVQVGLHRTFPVANLIGFVRFEAVQTEAIFLGVDRHGAKPQLGSRPHDTDGYFAAIECKKFFHVGIFQSIMELLAPTLRNGSKRVLYA